MDSLLGLDGKSALVVGGGQGMGESTSLNLARAGCNVAVADLERERAERVASRVGELGRKSVSLVADVLVDEQARGLITDAAAALGGLDILVCIVGQASWNPLLEMTDEQWDLDHRRNLRYFFVTARAAAAKMIESKTSGAIVCIASVSGLQSAPNHGAYGAAKAGLMNLVRTMAVEWARQGIRVNAIAPGSIATPRLPDSRVANPNDPASPIPMIRRGTTDEIGKAATFLASDLASYVTGHTLPVDGGWMAAFLTGVPNVALLTGG